MAALIQDNGLSLKKAELPPIVNIPLPKKIKIPPTEEAQPKTLKELSIKSNKVASLQHDTTNKITHVAFEGMPQEKQSKIQRESKWHRQRSFTISYEILVWAVFSIVTILCIVDHFVLKGDVVLKRSGKLPSKIWGTNLGETMTNVIWAVTARLLITSQNLMFYTTLWCFPNFLCEIAPRWITIDGIRDVHLRIHTFAGIFLIAIPSVAHVLAIFVPPLIDGTSIKYYPPSTFNYSNHPNHLNWTKIWDPAALEIWTFNDENGVHLTSDEIYRFVLTIVLFCCLIPLSRSQFATQRSYSMSIWLHAFAGIWYVIDNIRKISHGLAHVFNLPMLLIWCIDRILSIWLYRSYEGKIVHKEILGNNEYLVVYIKLDKVCRHLEHSVGDVYYFLHKVCGCKGMLPQRSHPFTTFSNLSEDCSWDIGLVVKIMEDTSQMCFPWTSWLAKNGDDISLSTWGPYRSAVSKLKDDLVKISRDANANQSRFILLATGSGCGYLSDVLNTLAYQTPPCENPKPNEKLAKIDIIYSVRCRAMCRFLHETYTDLLKRIKANNVADVSLTFYVTGHDVEDALPIPAEKELQLINDRADFEKVLKHANETDRCYFVGRPSIAEMIENICSSRNIRLVKDYTDGRGQDRDSQVFLKYLKYSFWVILFIVAVCVTLRFAIVLKEY